MLLRRHWLLSFLAYLAVIVTGCSDCCLDFPKFRDLRRPEVLTEWHWDELIDYECEAVVEEEEGPLFDPVNAPVRERLEEYILAQGDVLEMAVFGDDDTVVDDVVIAPNGNVYYAFFGEVPAAGHTAAQLGETLEKFFSSLYIKPIVTITPRTSLDKNYKILGRLQKPGVYPVLDHISLLDAIANAGGFFQEAYRETGRDNDIVFLADLKNSFIVRNGKKLSVNFEDLVLKGKTEHNIAIEPNDYIYIASSGAPAVYVLGAARSPQRVRYTRGMRLSQTLGIVGGWSSGLVNQTSGFGGGISLGSSGSGTAFAPDLTKIVIIRGGLENPRVMIVDFTLVLEGKARDLVMQPGDLVYASNKTMRFGRELARLAVDTFVQAFSSTAGGYYGQEVWFPSP